MGNVQIYFQISEMGRTTVGIIGTHISAWELMGGHCLETFTCTICSANTITGILLNEGLNVEVAFQCLFLDLGVTLAQLSLVVYKAIFKIVHLTVR